jgi:hypothetical protein
MAQVQGIAILSREQMSVDKRPAADARAPGYVQQVVLTPAGSERSFRRSRADAVVGDPQSRTNRCKLLLQGNFLPVVGRLPPGGGQAAADVGRGQGQLSPSLHEGAGRADAHRGDLPPGYARLFADVPDEKIHLPGYGSVVTGFSGELIHPGEYTLTGAHARRGLGGADVYGRKILHM